MSIFIVIVVSIINDSPAIWAMALMISSNTVHHEKKKQDLKFGHSLFLTGLKGFGTRLDSDRVTVVPWPETSNTDVSFPLSSPSTAL